MKEKNTGKDLDGFFKDAFEQWEQQPEEQVWDNIQGGIEPHDLDDLFRQSFEGEEVTPPEEVWDKIKPELPLNLWVRRQLSRLSIVAIILVIGMLVTLYLTRSVNQPVMESDAPVAQTEDVFNPLPPFMETEVVAEVEEKEEPATLATDNSLEKQKGKAAVLEIQDTKDDFVINEEKIREILKPLEALPWEESFANSFIPVEVSDDFSGDENSELVITNSNQLEIIEVEPIPEIRISVDVPLNISD